MDKNRIILLGVGTIVLLLGYRILEQRLYKACPSHDYFGFRCHHNDTNTDIYLRRLNAKLDKVIDLIDSTSMEMRTLQKIHEKAAESELMISYMLRQLRLVKAGNLHLGSVAGLMPDFLRNGDDKFFDYKTDEFVASATELKNYTQEEAKAFRGTLLSRTSNAGALECLIKFQVGSRLRDLIKEELAMVMIGEYSDSLPQNFESLIRNRYNLVDRDSAKRNSVMKAISDGTVCDEYDLEAMIRKTYFGKDY